MKTFSTFIDIVDLSRKSSFLFLFLLYTNLYTFPLSIVSHKSTNALPTDSCSHRNNNNTIETKSPSKVYNSESMLLDNADTTSEATRKDYSSPEKRKDHDWKRDALVSQRPTPNAIVKPSAGDSESTATTSASK